MIEGEVIWGTRYDGGSGRARGGLRGVERGLYVRFAWFGGFGSWVNGGPVMDGWRVSRSRLRRARWPSLRARR